ncbi:MAG: flagellar basal body rod protein FlgB [Spirochaetales bacterium]|nr:flagellar basal body rod protein FlgB [Spirochaetales bacterium]
MFEDSSFGKTVDILKRGLNVANVRQGVIANNIANVETPNFKRSDVSFESELGRALASEENQGTLKAKTSSERHIDFNQPRDYKDVEPRINLDYLTTAKNNGNNVDIEVEEMNALKNQMRYELLMETVSHEFTLVNMVIK